MAVSQRYTLTDRGFGKSWLLYSLFHFFLINVVSLFLRYLFLSSWAQKTIKSKYKGVSHHIRYLIKMIKIDLSAWTTNISIVQSTLGHNSHTWKLHQYFYFSYPLKTRYYLWLWIEEDVPLNASGWADRLSAVLASLNGYLTCII